MPISDIKIFTLSKIEVEGGKVLHAIKNDDEGFKGLGEVYFSFIESGAVKAWKLHKEMTLNLVVPLGMVRFVFCDPIKPNDFRVEDIGEDNYVRLNVPPNIWFGFQGISDMKSLITNIANIKHDPEEVERKELKDFSYKWGNI
tara:strand:+ start:436 stop:864 length:429 start_codon:yes stop_codon:yes gene_type:complete